MVNPQKGRGYVGIANEIWDEIIRRDFSKRQKDILQFVLRLSYGCNQKKAIIPRMKDFAICGVQPNHIKEELQYLEACKVITWERESNEFYFRKDFTFWQVSPVKGWDEKRFKELIHLNLKHSQNGKSELPETGSLQPSENFPKQEVKNAKTGSSEDSEDFPKRESKLPETGSDDEGEQIILFPEMGSFDENNFPKKEVQLPEKGSTTPDEANNGAASGASKKGLKKEVIKKELKEYTSDFEFFWSLYPRQIGKKAAFDRWNQSLKKGFETELLIRCAENYRSYCEAMVSDETFILHPSTFLYWQKERFKDYEEAKAWPAKKAGSNPQNANDRLYEKNKQEVLKIKEAMERAGIRTKAPLLEN